MLTLQHQPTMTTTTPTPTVNSKRSNCSFVHHGTSARLSQSLHAFHLLTGNTLRPTPLNPEPVTVQNSTLNGTPFASLSPARLVPYLQQRFRVYPGWSSRGRTVYRNYLRFDVERLRKALLRELLRNRSAYLSSTTDKATPEGGKTVTYHFTLGPPLCAICYELGHAAPCCVTTSVGLRGRGLDCSDVERMVDAIIDTSHPVLELELRDNRIGDRGACAIARLIRANTPDFRATQDAWVLGLTGNLIGAQGLSKISDALRHTRSLSRLSLCANRFDAAAFCEFVSGAVRRNASLVELACYPQGEVPATDDTLMAVADALRSNVFVESFSFEAPVTLPLSPSGHHHGTMISPERTRLLGEIDRMLQENRVFALLPVRACADLLRKSRVLLHIRASSPHRLPPEISALILELYGLRTASGLTAAQCQRIIGFAADRTTLVAGSDVSFREFLTMAFCGDGVEEGDGARTEVMTDGGGVLRFVVGRIARGGWEVSEDEEIPVLGTGTIYTGLTAQS